MRKATYHNVTLSAPQLDALVEAAEARLAGLCEDVNVRSLRAASEKLKQTRDRPPPQPRMRTCPICQQRVAIHRGANAEHTARDALGQPTVVRCSGSGLAPIPRGHE